MTDRDSRSKQPDEPSVDEILASIRQIVFEDDGPGPAPDTDIREAEIPTPGIPAAKPPVAGVDRAATDPAARLADTGAPPSEPPRQDETEVDEDLAAVDPGAAEEAPPPEPPPSAPAPDIAQATAGAAEKAPPPEPPPTDIAEAAAGAAEEARPQEPPAPAPAPDGAETAARPVAEKPVGAGFDPDPEPEAGPDPEASPDLEAGPDPDDGETVLLLTDMIAPDGSVVRLDPRPAEASLPDRPPTSGTKSPGAGEGGGEGAGEGALDPATRDSLAATVREWLDRNAPDMVDRAARRELQKLAERQA